MCLLTIGREPTTKQITDTTKVQLRLVSGIWVRSYLKGTQKENCITKPTSEYVTACKAGNQEDIAQPADSSTVWKASNQCQRNAAPVSLSVSKSHLFLC